MNEKIRNDTIKCSICRCDINPQTSFFQSAVNFDVVCSSCKQKFSEEGITLILKILLLSKSISECMNALTFVWKNL
jgi:hypothetical protein